MVRSTIYRCLALVLLGMGSAWPANAASSRPSEFHCYVGQITSSSVLLAWGTANGEGNTIGRSSTAHGQALVKIGKQRQQSDRNWIVANNLDPDTKYPYEVSIGQQEVGAGIVRTYPRSASRLAFFVIGDWGTGKEEQSRIGQAMWEEFDRRRKTDLPVRFVLTTGDNIYKDKAWFFPAGNSGSKDKHWRRKFFRPYAQLLKHIPFYPTLGNHDGNESEKREDLEVYLDNFFFPENSPHRYYRFTFANLAELFALDTTKNTTVGPPQPIYAAEAKQHRWISASLASSKVPWKIPFFHHPPFTAGPRHRPSNKDLGHFLSLFESAGVRVAFSGHEHNFQYSERDATGGICYVVTGAGGELRRGDIRGRMQQRKIAGWSPRRHFLVVEIRGQQMRIIPLDENLCKLTDQNGRQIVIEIDNPSQKDR